MAHPVSKITQCHAYNPLSGRRYGSFAGRSQFIILDDGLDASNFKSADLGHSGFKSSAHHTHGWGWHFSLPNIFATGGRLCWKP